MERFTKEARKYWVAAGGIGLLIALRYLDVEIPGLPTFVFELIVGAFTAEAVYQTRNGE
jgi:hypothetical protein